MTEIIELFPITAPPSVTPATIGDVVGMAVEQIYASALDARAMGLSEKRIGEILREVSDDFLGE